MTSHTLCVAPMLDYTDRHDRYFLRLISRHTRLYTEMVTSSAILRGDRNRFLNYHEAEHPLALQLGGSDPVELALCARIGEDYGYDEINLNVGCPSERVSSGSFGACLMATPDVVAECVAAMREAAKSTPITVKHRIGIDHQESYEHLHRFVDSVSNAGCNTFIVHARKAWLKGLSPKENREIPPLDYDKVYRLKQDFPKLAFIINGGIKTLEQARQLISGTHTKLDGAMIGREAYHNPYLLSQADRLFYDPNAAVKSRTDVLAQLIDYIQVTSPPTPVYAITRHILGLFQGLPGARHWRQQLSQRAIFEPNWLKILTQLKNEFSERGY
ncbi:MAG: tRNA dihydrouridine(20/20a) synthase DusA [Gammaproteobacteria bacterium]|nr:tRNA dihydrouridine(20/20a) synthase DusA [Gammaproteobacteria bacterium]